MGLAQLERPELIDDGRAAVLRSQISVNSLDSAGTNFKARTARRFVDDGPGRCTPPRGGWLLSLLR